MSTINYATERLSLPHASGMRFGIVVARWNRHITRALEEGAVQTLKTAGVSEEDMLVRYVPGSFELTAAAQWMIEYGKVDAVIAIGCVIQGETPHFTYICQNIANGFAQLTVKYNGFPVIFGVLTVNTLEQALARAGGEVGNKGAEAAETAIRMIELHREMQRMIAE